MVEDCVKFCVYSRQWDPLLKGTQKTLLIKVLIKDL